MSETRAERRRAQREAKHREKHPQVLPSVKGATKTEREEARRQAAQQAREAEVRLAAMTDEERDEHFRVVRKMAGVATGAAALMALDRR